jgi:hypothetical protein
MSIKPAHCAQCGAPRGELVTRRKQKPSVWALDLDLSEEYPSTWAKPSRVNICASGLCRRCEGMKESAA